MITRDNIAIKSSELISGLNFPESPFFDRKGMLWFTELKAGCLCKWHHGKLFRFPVGNQINGAVCDASGKIWYTDSGNHRVGMFDPETGTTRSIISSVKGERLVRPNDLAFDRLGNLLVTCHADGREEPLGYIIAIDRHNKARKIIDEKFFTNGIAFSPKGDFFIYAETYAQTLWKAYWDDQYLRVDKEEVFAKTDGPLGPDGIAFDSSGQLYASIFDQSKISVFNPAGEQVDEIHLPYARPTNCAFDPKGKLGLVITEAETGKVLIYPTNNKGNTIFYR